MKKLNILYEDKYIIIVNKESGLLTIANEKEREKTLYYEVSSYVKKKHKNNKIFIVHRLDRDTSGIVLFAKSEKVKKILQDNWENVIRKYYAVVNGKVLKTKDIIKSYLFTTKTNLTVVSNNKSGKLAITEYIKISDNNKYSLLDIDIKTGRKNQIRVQLNSIGHPILGDKLFVKRNGNIKRLYLHAYYLEFVHPISKEIIIINTGYPKDFNLIIQKKD